MTEINRSMTFRQAIEPWLQSRKPFITERTWKDYNYCKKPLLEFFGAIHLSEITPGKIRQYQTWRLQKCGGHSINHECSILQQMLKRVGVWKEIIEDYQPIPLPDLGPGRSISDIEEEAWFAAAAIRPSWIVAYLASMISINSSAGPSEILNLKLENVRIEDDPPQIHILHSVKNKYRIRHVPLNDKARWAAEQLLIRAKEIGSIESHHYLIPFRLRKKTYDPTRPAKSWRQAHEEICATAGITFRQYDLRHTAITRLLERGTPEGTVMAICGHVSRAMLQRYSHIQMKSKLQAVQRIMEREEQQRNGPPVPKQERRTYLRVMVNCPETRKLVFTGMATEEKDFRSQDGFASVFTCPECKLSHQWQKSDAYLLP